ncbi:protein SENSITIVITY TO RED LIGHT REDUCED 1-like [Melia azedarach]|uniref:Protein SENSITIVITY TO RED LIGHT REDUCED 1-like n=2 Tax=Melia azedarach TaxID=155640 RepID=A0ACC1YLL1_MELAZ|nr:protein SENSITIVITY TO RED LIGHT REDUCED 1-like [Melia azedarach]KAJ4724643.1 protein SENSITIVITY TO RED LIGHT REDUCED 1-like [Melia azedarach]
MSASSKVLAPETRIRSEDWTIVLPRRGKQGKKFPRIRTPEEQQKPWSPAEIEFDPCRVSRLLQKIQICITKMESSQFYQTLVEQIQTPNILNSFYNVLGSELKMQMVIYGIGSLESYETPRLQLSLAILMKRKFSWIGDIEVFDPILSATEAQVLESLGCSVLSVNEQGRRCAIKPTLFFMPHCEAELYNNLLQANWGVMLKNMVVFGNSFEMYHQHVSEFKNSIVANTARHVLAARRFTHEYSIKTVSDDYYAAFHDSSWLFFSPDHETQLQSTEI